MIYDAAAIEKRKEERKQEIRSEMERERLYIGMVVVKTNHSKGCICWNCVTLPEPFIPFPDEHKKFVNVLFSAVKSP